MERMVEVERTVEVAAPPKAPSPVPSADEGGGGVGGHAELLRKIGVLQTQLERSQSALADEVKAKALELKATAETKYEEGKVIAVKKVEQTKVVAQKVKVVAVETATALKVRRASPSPF